MNTFDRVDYEGVITAHGSLVIKVSIGLNQVAMTETEALSFANAIRNMVLEGRAQSDYKQREGTNG